MSVAKLVGSTLVVYEDLDAVRPQIESFLKTMTHTGSTVSSKLGDISSLGQLFSNTVVFGCSLSSLSLELLLSVMNSGGTIFLINCSSTESRALNRLVLFSGITDVTGTATNLVGKKPEWIETAKPVPTENCDNKPKACKNCSCGRKDAEDDNVSPEEFKRRLESGEIKSSCGSCYLGDDFRCATCPFRGQPAFAPGEKVTVNL